MDSADEYYHHGLRLGPPLLRHLTSLYHAGYASVADGACVTGRFTIGIRVLRLNLLDAGSTWHYCVSANVNGAEGPDVGQVMADQSLGQSSVEDAEAIAPRLMHATAVTVPYSQHIRVDARVSNRNSAGVSPRAGVERGGDASTTGHAFALLALLLSLCPQTSVLHSAQPLQQRLREAIDFATPRR